MTSAEETFSLTQVALRRSSPAVQRESLTGSSVLRASTLRLPGLHRISSREKSPLRQASVKSSRREDPARVTRTLHSGSQSTLRFTTAARSLLENLSQEVLKDVAQLSARPSDLLQHMQKLEKTQAVQGQLAQLQAQVLQRKRDCNKTQAERRAKESQLARLNDELNSLILSSQSDNRKEVCQAMQTRLDQALEKAENEQHYSKVLEWMHDVRAKGVLALNKPIVQLKTKLAQLKLQQQESDRHTANWLLTAKLIEEEQARFIMTMTSQQAKRKQQKAETLAVVRQQLEFEACSDRYRDFSEAALMVERNGQDVENLQRQQKRAQEFEVVAAELQGHEAYINRQEVNLSKLRTVAFIAKVEEIASYYEYLKDTENSLSRLSEQMMQQLAEGQDEVARLTKELTATALKTDSNNSSTLPSTVDIEDTLHAKTTHLEDLEMKVNSIQIQHRQTLIMEVCEALTRLLRRLSGDQSDPPTAKSFAVVQAFTQLDAAYAAVLSRTSRKHLTTI